MSCDQALDKLSEKLNSRRLVQEEHGFQKGGAQCPPWPQELKKKLGLDRVKPFTSHGEKSFSNGGPLLWNHLPQDLRARDCLPLCKMTFLDLLSPQLLSLTNGDVKDYV